MKPLTFTIPDTLNAAVPPEKRGISRDDVKLLVLDKLTGEVEHGQFNQLADYLNPGDLIVLNNSRTIPAVLKGKQGKKKIEIRLSRKISSNEWDALVVGELINTELPLTFPNDLKAKIIGEGSEAPLVRIEFSKCDAELMNIFYQFGEPVRYEYIETPWPLTDYQTVYASVPGSVEMPSAGRAFSWRLINRLRDKGIKVAFLQLHAGLSYYGKDRWPNPKNHPEQYVISTETANLVNETKANGGRIIAVGTTVVRALESAINQDEQLVPRDALTRLYINKEHQLKMVDGLITGFHEPEASHLDLLTAFIEKNLLMNAYQNALLSGYLWHEFGDINLILPVEK